ncbi:MAG: S1/P1 nuclease [Bryobacteraceae bacterium]
MNLKPAVPLALCYLLAVPSFSWWETGHRAVARIAASYLNPKTRTRVAQILGVKDTPQSVANAMAQASTWADETKEQTKTGEWHYIDLALQDSEKDIPKRCPEENCVTARIEIFTRQLGRRTPTGLSDRDALRYLIHFVGDVHQPLHTISDADLGGNCERITPVDEAKNLHALWDGGIVNSLHSTDIQLADNLEGYIGRLSGGERRKWSKGDAKSWTWESHKLAEQDIYQRLHIPLEPVVFPKTCQAAPAEIANFRPYIDSLYINDMKPVVRDQLSKAGLRLARVLNQTLK